MRGVLDHAGHDDADALAAATSRVFGEQRLDAAGQRRDQRLRIADGGKRDDAGERLADQVGQHQEGFAGADVGGHDRAPPGVDVEERRLAAAFGLAGGALEDSSLRSSRSLTMRVTAARLTPIARARSAREIGWWVRTRFRTMRLLISRLVPRVATLKRDGLMRRMTTLSNGLTN